MLHMHRRLPQPYLPNGVRPLGSRTLGDTPTVQRPRRRRRRRERRGAQESSWVLDRFARETRDFEGQRKCGGDAGERAAGRDSDGAWREDVAGLEFVTGPVVGVAFLSV